MKLDLAIQPKNLDEAINQIIAALEPDDIDYIKTVESSELHFSLGMYLRNNLNLWKRDSDINIWFQKTYGLGHADDLSSIILDGVWSEVCKKPRITTELVKEFKNHWRHQGVSAIDGSSLNGL